MGSSRMGSLWDSGLVKLAIVETKKRLNLDMSQPVICPFLAFVDKSEKHAKAKREK